MGGEWQEPRSTPSWLLCGFSVFSSVKWEQNCPEPWLGERSPVDGSHQPAYTCFRVPARFQCRKAHTGDPTEILSSHLQSSLLLQCPPLSFHVHFLSQETRKPPGGDREVRVAGGVLGYKGQGLSVVTQYHHSPRGTEIWRRVSRTPSSPASPSFLSPLSGVLPPALSATSAK